MGTIEKEALQKAVDQEIVIQKVESTENGSCTFFEKYPEMAPFAEKVPEFVRIVFAMKPSADSNIHAEFCIPVKEWNGRFLGTGNGGPGCTMNAEPIVNGLLGRFAVVQYDLGTSPEYEEGITDPEKWNPDAAVGKPEIWKDYGWRANHLAAVTAKKLIAAVTDRAPEYSYFVGASTGGQQGLAEAQRFPEDYDGIITQVPGSNRTFLHTYFLWTVRNFTDTEGKPRFTDADVEKIYQIACGCIEECGLGTKEDGFLTSPAYDAGLVGKVMERVRKENFLTEEQLAALQTIYDGPVNEKTGERVYCGLPVGAELSLQFMKNPEWYVYGSLFPQYWVYGKNYDYKTFNMREELDDFAQKLAPEVNANSADLHAFCKRGGKMIMTGGQQDMVVPAQEITHYYERVIDEMGGLDQTRKFFRYYLIPGYGHTMPDREGTQFLGSEIEEAGWSVPFGHGTSLLHDLMKWVEEGIAPEYVLATGFTKDNQVRFQRPIYAYPDIPKYQGGDPLKPESFAKETGKRHPEIDCCAKRYLIL